MFVFEVRYAVSHLSSCIHINTSHFLLQYIPLKCNITVILNSVKYYINKKEPFYGLFSIFRASQKPIFLIFQESAAG